MFFIQLAEDQSKHHLTVSIIENVIDVDQDDNIPKTEQVDTQSFNQTNNFNPIHYEKCCVPFCNAQNTNDNNLVFHTLPIKKTHLLQWLHNLKLPLELDADYSNHRICNRHFERNCFRYDENNREIL